MFGTAVWTSFFGAKKLVASRRADGATCLGRGRGDASSESEVLSRRAISVHQGVYGMSHTEVADAVSNLGVCLYLQLRLSEARALFLRVLSIRLKVLGESHPDTKEAQRWLHACIPEESEPVDRVAARFGERTLRHR